MAFDAADKARDRKPLYIGLKEVVIPKKFHIKQIVADNMAHIAEFFLQELKDN